MMTKFKKYYLYLTIFITGAVVLIIEILGTRIIAPFYGSTIFVWSSLISVALGFLALGYWLGGLVSDKRPSFRIFYGTVFLTGFILPLAIKVNQPVLIFSDKFGLQFGPLVATFILFSIPLFLLGSLTPLAIRLETHLLEKIGRRSGSIFAIATIGSLVGALLSGFVLIPLLSISTIFYATSAILVITALVGFILARDNMKTVIGGVIVFLGVMFLPFVQDSSYTATAILYQTNTFYGDVKITGSNLKPCLYVNGSNQTCVDLSDPKTPQGSFNKQSLALMEALPAGSRVLLLGLGGGGIVAVAPENITLDVVEIDPQVAELAKKHFGITLKDKQNLFIDDARRFVRKSSSDTYDLIIEDIALGSHLPAYIFSEESFREMKRILRPSGLLIAHIGVGSDSKTDRFSEALVKTARSTFSTVKTYSSHPSNLSNFVLYLYDRESVLTSEPEFYYHYSDIAYASAQAMTDDHNVLEGYYISHALNDLRNSRNIGNAILFVQ